MFTIDEAKELCDKCQWEEGLMDEVKGYYATGPNGNTIFIPFAGYKHQTDEIEVGVSCWLWPGTFSEIYSNDNCHWGDSYGWKIYDIGWEGMSIRPVKD